MRFLFIALVIGMSPSVVQGQCFTNTDQQALDGYYVEVEALEDGNILLLERGSGITRITKISPSGDILAENDDLRHHDRMAVWEDKIFVVGEPWVKSVILQLEDLTPVTYPFTKWYQEIVDEDTTIVWYLDTLQVFMPNISQSVSIGTDDDHIYVLSQQWSVYKYTWADSALIEVDRLHVGTSYQEDMQIVGEEIYSFGTEWIMDEFTGNRKEYNSAYITDKMGNHLRTVRWPRPEAQNSLEVRILEHGVMFVIGFRAIEVRSPTGHLLCRDTTFEDYVGSSYRDGILYTLSHDLGDTRLLMLTPSDYGTSVKSTTWGHIKSMYKGVTQ